MFYHADGREKAPSFLGAFLSRWRKCVAVQFLARVAVYELVREVVGVINRDAHEVAVAARDRFIYATRRSRVAVTVPRPSAPWAIVPSATSNCKYFHCVSRVSCLVRTGYLPASPEFMSFWSVSNRFFLILCNGNVPKIYRNRYTTVTITMPSMIKH